MLQRIKRLWALSRKDPKQIDKLLEVPGEIIAKLPEPGDGKAVFFSEGSQEEFEEQLKEDKGLAAWYRRIRNL